VVAKVSLLWSRPTASLAGTRTPLPSTSVEEALAALLEQFEPGSPVAVPLEQSLGLVLAESLVAEEQHPAHDTSAMDGYAVRAALLLEASEERPVELTIREDIQAGFPPQLDLLGQCTSRISTGALVPNGADAVVMREFVEVVEPNIVRFREPIPVGTNIRFAGEHLQGGEEVLSAGTRLHAAQIGMAAFLGAATVHCFDRVRVSVLATGSELVKVGGEVKKGQIRDSNSLAIAAALQTLGCEVTMRAQVEDSPGALDEALLTAFAKSQVVITSGGISAGWHDLVREAIESRGGQFSFHKLRMRPGKPLAFGHLGPSRFFCLPGNPVSSLVTFEIFVKPALLKMMGRPHEPEVSTAILQETITKRRGFSIYFRGVLEKSERGENTVRLTGPQGSHILRSLTQADVLIKTREDQDVLEAGSKVEVIPYNLV
jgi:molybdopterin molybdotransferase